MRRYLTIVFGTLLGLGELPPPQVPSGFTRAVTAGTG